MSTIIGKYVGDLNLTNQKVDMAIDIILCQVPHIDPTTEEYKKHVELFLIRGKYVFGTHVVLTHLSNQILRDGGRIIEEPREHIPPTRDNIPGESINYPLLNPEHLPIETCFDVKIPHPKPRFWCNHLALPQ